MQNLSHENEFDLHLNELVSKTDFNMKGFALELVLKQSQKEPEMAYYVCIFHICNGTTLIYFMDKFSHTFDLEHVKNTKLQTIKGSFK